MKSDMHLRTIVILLAMAMGIAAAETPSPAGPWSLKFALPPDQKAEWTAKGYLPSWKITWSDRERPTLRIDDDEKGDCRGFVFVGRMFDIPKLLPRDMKVSFRYKTCCAADNPPLERAGQVAFFVFTPGQWAALSDDPARSKPVDVWRAREFSEFGEIVYRDLKDVTDWRGWTSDNLAPSLRPHAGKRLVMAMAWGCFHYGCAEWGELDDFRFSIRTEAEMAREFFASLNLDYPGIEQVKVAVGADDIPAARRALVAHMETRAKPEPPPVAGRTDAGFIAAADKIVDHVFQFVGCPPHPLGKEIQWNEDPFDYDQWAIALNRHSHWLTLAQAYTGMHDEKYAREFTAQLMSWINAMPVNIGAHWAQGPYHVPGRSPLSLDAGIRMGQTWFPAYYHFLHSPSFTDEAHFAMLRSFRDHALYLMDERHYKTGSNWGMMECNGLLHIGVMLPEFKDAELWRRTAIERMNAELGNQFYPDGAQTELSPGYHGVSVGNALGALDAARRTGTPLPEDMTAKLERTFEYYLRIMTPDGCAPALNDSGRGSVRRWLEQGHELFPHREDFRFAATQGREGRAPDFTSCVLSYAGWYIMRTGWTKGDKYLLLDAGPFGTGHQHEDKLHIIVHAFGRDLVADAGNYSYDASEWRKYVLSTRAHNTVMVDGQEQCRRRQRDTWRSAAPLADRWLSNDSVDYAEGTYCDGYGEKMDKSVTHTRRILFVKPDYWIVVDQLTPSDEKEHTIESLFHLDAPSADVDANTKIVTTTNPAGGNVAIVPLVSEGIDVEIATGWKEPVVQGWMPTGRHNDLRPIPTAILRCKRSGPILLAYAIVPYEGNHLAAVPKVGAVPSQGPSPRVAVRLAFADGRSHLFAFAGRSGEKLSIEDFETDGEMALVKRDADGKAGLLLYLAGTYLRGAGRHEEGIISR